MFDGDEGDDEEDFADYINYMDVKGSNAEWLQSPQAALKVRKLFTNFLRTFKDEDTNVSIYENRIMDMCVNNKQSLEVTFTHISDRLPNFSIWIAEHPSIILPVLNIVALDLTLEINPDYDKIHKEIFVRVRDLPIQDSLRGLRQQQIDVMVNIKGVVTKRSEVFPDLQQGYYRC